MGGRLDTARALFREVEWLAPDRAPRINAELAFALARAGRGADALAALTAIPVQTSDIWEATVVATGYRAAVALAAQGDAAGARAIAAAMDRRYARFAK